MLLRTLSGELPALEGKVSCGNALVVGNLTQEHDNLPREESIKDFLTRRAGIQVQESYALSVKFGFKAVEIDKPISALSPGGRHGLSSLSFPRFLQTRSSWMSQPTLQPKAVYNESLYIAFFFLKHQTRGRGGRKGLGGRNSVAPSRLILSADRPLTKWYTNGTFSDCIWRHGIQPIRQKQST